GTIAGGSRNTEAARIEPIAVLLGDRICLARKERFIDSNASITHQRPINNDLIACMQNQKIILHNLPRIDRLLLPIADNGRPGSCEQSDTIKRPFSAYLLYNANHHIEEDRACRQKSLRELSKKEQGQTKNEQNIVHQSKNVLADNLEVRAIRG